MSAHINFIQSNLNHFDILNIESSNHCFFVILADFNTNHDYYNTNHYYDL